MVDQPTKLNIDPGSVSGLKNARAIRKKASAYDRYTSWLVFLIIAITFLLIRDVVVRRVETPRTSIERDVLDFGARIEADPKDAPAHAGLGAAYMRMGRYRAAAAAFTKAVDLRPDSAQFHYNLGMARAKLEDYDQALEEFAKAKSALNKWDAPYYESGLVYIELKEYDKAIKELEKSLEIAGENADAHYFLGRAFELRGRKSDALTSYRAALKYVPDLEDAVQAIERLTAKGAK